jgi:hypothetical protein
LDLEILNFLLKKVFLTTLENRIVMSMLAGGDGGTAGNVMIKSTDGGNTWVGRSITGMTQILCIAFKSSLV